MATQRRGTKKATKAKTKAAKADAKTKKSTAPRKTVAGAARKAKPKAKPKAASKAKASGGRAKGGAKSKTTTKTKTKTKTKAKPTPSAAKAAKPAPRAKAKAKAKAKPTVETAKPKRKAAARGGQSPRRDAVGHLDAGYAKKLRALSRASRNDDGAADAFVHGSRAPDDLAEELAEEAVATMTSGEYESADVRDSEVPEEMGGPFVPSTGAREFAPGTDLSNPTDAEREPFPRT